MKTLTELAEENGAIVEINKEWNNDKKLFETTNVIIATEAEHQATFAAYCVQLSEPIYQVSYNVGVFVDTTKKVYEGMDEYFKKRKVYLAPQPNSLKD